jgi:hypothetical protein
MNRACSTNWDKSNAYRILVEKPERKRSLRTPRLMWVNNIKMELGETGWGVADWTNVAQNRDHWRALMSMVMKLSVQ